MTVVAKPISPGMIRGRPSVTVLIPCYNYGRFLNQCVNSVLAQDGVDVRVIVVDDASTDDTGKTAAELAQRDSRVRLILLQKNLGMIPAVNLGLREVDSDYFVKLDADDMLTPGSLQRSVALLERYPNIGFVYGRPHDFSGDAPNSRRRWTLGALVEWIITRGCASYTVWRGSRWLELRYRRGHNCIMQPEAVIRCSVLRTVGEYNPKLAHTSDLEMWLRLAAISDVGRINRGEQGYYRVHPDSMQRTVNSGLLTDLIGRKDAFLSEALAPSIQNLSGGNLEEIVRKELSVHAIEAACAAFDREPTGSVPVDRLVEFAASTFPAVTTLPQWHRLERRRHMKWRSRWSPTASIASTMRYFRHEFAYLRWFRTGV